MPPTIGEYFGSFNLFLLFLAFGALAEEIVFRGILQTKFIQFFGQFRGIFLVSLVWAAYHFPFASYWNLSDAAIVGHVFTRVLSCLALGFVFSWLTLKSHSVLPSALAHFVFNVFASLGIRDAFSGSHLLTLTLWAVFAYVLFRYRPVEEAKQTDIQLPVVNPEPAT
jgi:membrane protease YdiL (CAAX protease family)